MNPDLSDQPDWLLKCVCRHEKTFHFQGSGCSIDGCDCDGFQDPEEKVKWA